jgi:protein-arginine kinase activator protein McsA
MPEQQTNFQQPFTLAKLLICPWCYMPFTALDTESLKCPNCNRSINESDIQEENDERE